MTAHAVSRVLVLAGGLTFERDVSLRSGRRVAEALRGAGVEVEVADTDAALLPALRTTRPDAAFIALHGGAGENGAVRAVLDLLGVPYVGSAPDACRLAFDKPSAKAAVRRAGLDTPDWIALPQETFRELGAHALLTELLTTLGLPVVVKPAYGGSALGVTAVERAEDLAAAVMHCFSYGDTALVERRAVGTEVAVSVIEDDGEPVALPVVEIVPRSGTFDYAARYTAGATDYFVPARLPPDGLAQAARAAVGAHRALGLRDVSRTDLIVTEAGPQFLEVNVAPGMTETSLLPMAAACAGRDLGELCLRALQRAVERQSAD